MPISIASYKVGVSRAHDSRAARWLTLALAKPSGPIKAVSLFFYEGTPPDRGFVNRETGMVVANLPLADFDATYHIVQTEKPVFVSWRTDPEGNSVVGIDVSTSEEPLGEGFRDRSA